MSVKDPHDLVDQLLILHPPKDESVAQVMDLLREEFINLGHSIAAVVPQTPEQTIAIRKLHEACMATIAAVACNQEELSDAGQEGHERLERAFERGFGERSGAGS